MLERAISRQFLSHLPDGSMSYLYYAQRLVEIPQGMFALAVGSAALPSVATTIARGDTEGSKRILRDALRLTLFVAIPSSIALAVLATPTVDALFGHGRFDASAVRETSLSLVYQSLGIAAVSAVRTIVPMFYGMKDTRTPVVASATNLVFFAGTAWLLVPTMGHAAVALALTVASVAQLVVLLVLLRLRAGTLGLSEVLASAAKTTCASLLAGAAMYAASRYGHAMLGGMASRALIKIAALAAYGLVGALVFVVCARALGIPEVTRILDGVRRKLGPERIS